MGNKSAPSHALFEGYSLFHIVAVAMFDAIVF